MAVEQIPAGDEISKESIRRYLGELYEVFEPEVFQEIDSTNSYLNSKTKLKMWHTAIASAQTAGRGRRGRTFASPAGTGLYLSVFTDPAMLAIKTTMITTAAAVAACRAIEECTAEKALIKWVNDVFVRGRKVCGILTEATADPEDGIIKRAVMGIGFNVYKPLEGFPEEIRDIAGAITENKSTELRSRIAAKFLKEFYMICSDPECGYVNEYRKRSFIIGMDINVISGNLVKPARAVGINDDCNLKVIYEDGTEESLSSGEVSIRPRNTTWLY